MNDRLYNLKEISEYLGLSESCIYTWVNQRQIPFIKLGRSLKFRFKDIERWIDENTIVSEKYDFDRPR